MSQSAVSQTVKRLEGDLGIKLSSRSTRSLNPPAAGERLLDKLAIYAEIDGELSVENRHVYIVAEWFGIGIRLREDLEIDMIAVPVGQPLRAVVVGTPDYLGTCEPPRAPRQLSANRCIGYRNAGGSLSQWSFEKDGHAETVNGLAVRHRQ